MHKIQTAGAIQLRLSRATSPSQRSLRLHITTKTNFNFQSEELVGEQLWHLFGFASVNMN